MSLSIGIVGLPNVGKSTLFKALTKKQALIANYPFATIDPNVGIVEVPDERLDQLSKVSQSTKTVHTTIEFVDIAGLVKGASQGEGLGNKFLSHIREVSAIIQVVRSFTDSEIIHVNGVVNPQNDFEVVNTELALADLDQACRKLTELKSNAKAGLTHDLELEIALFEKIKVVLGQGQSIRDLSLTDEEKLLVKPFNFLTAKPMLVVMNCDEGEAVAKMPKIIGNIPVLAISAKIEAELADLSAEEAKDFMQALGQAQTGLDKLILAGYKLLDLITFLTSGPQESRAWTIKRGAKAPQAAGVIHTDFEKGFIRVEICNWADFVKYGDEAGVKEKGLWRLEGKEYIMKDGDVCYFRFSV